MRNIPYNKLPEGYQKEIEIGHYEFYINKNKNGIIWRRKNKDIFIYSKNMKDIPKEEKTMFWYDPKYHEDFF